MSAQGKAARDKILATIRAANGPARASAEAIAAEAAALVAEPAAVQPQFGPDAIERFIAKATSERVTATVARLPAAADIPAAVSAYLDEAGLPPEVAVQPTGYLQGLDWSGIAVSDAAPAADGGVCVTLAEWGIAETGSVAFRSGRDAPMLMNLLPLHHLVVLRAETILRYNEELWPRLGGAGAEQPRLLSLVTGTSGTADIEAKNVRGAHGPKHMRILVIDGA